MIEKDVLVRRSRTVKRGVGKVVDFVYRGDLAQGPVTNKATPPSSLCCLTHGGHS